MTTQQQRHADSVSSIIQSGLQQLPGGIKSEAEREMQSIVTSVLEEINKNEIWQFPARRRATRTSRSRYGSRRKGSQRSRPKLSRSKMMRGGGWWPFSSSTPSASFNPSQGSTITARHSETTVVEKARLILSKILHSRLFEAMVTAVSGVQAYQYLFTNPEFLASLRHDVSINLLKNLDFIEAAKVAMGAYSNQMLLCIRCYTS